MSATLARPRTEVPEVLHIEDIVTRPGARRALAVTRIFTGFYFLWAFLDKLLGLGYSTPTANAWINGGSPAQGFLGGVVNNEAVPFNGFFGLFQNGFGDVLFMAGLLGIGVALITGAGLKIAAVAGITLMTLMWWTQTGLWVDSTNAPGLAEGARTASNPLLTSHWFEGGMIALAALTRSGDQWGLGRWWSKIVGDSWLR